MDALNSRKHRKLILLNVLVALALVTFLISILGDGFDLHNANGQTANLMAGNVGVEYNNRVFDITDVSIKYDDVWGPTMIGLIQNKDQNSKIEGVTLSVQMYDRNNHLIGVMKGYPQSGDIQPNQKTAFEIQSGDEEIRNIDHVFIEILATDWGTSTSYIPPVPTENVSAVGSNSSERPYVGIIGVSLDPDLSKQIGLNDTKGVLLTQIPKDSPAEKSDLRAGSNTTTYNDREINIGGDIIQKIDDREVSYLHDITAYIQSQKNIGDNVTLTILRDNATKNVNVTLGQWPSQGPAVFAGENDTLQNPYFSIKIPKTWAYREYSNTIESQNTGFGPVNTIVLSPYEFGEIILIRDTAELREKIEDEGAIAAFIQDTNYPKNAPLESYVKYQIDNLGIPNITSQQYTTVGKEKSVRIDANESAQFGNIAKIALYLVMHDKEPYYITYTANAKNYEKYLPEFEQIVKSFKFADSPLSEIENLSENENITNTKTNFSGANVTEFTRNTSDSNSPEELYDECVSAAGKSFCDFLFKR